MLRLLCYFVFLWALLAACGPTASPDTTPTPTETPTLLPTPTDVPTLQPSITPEPTLTPSQTLIPVEIEQLTQDELPVPIDLSLPAGWALRMSRGMVMRDVDSTIATVPVTVFSGPVTGGTGYIILFWGFPNLGANLFATQTIEQIMWAEGLRFFRMALVEEDCVPGTDLQNTFSVGGKTASGARFSIVDCPPPLRDTRGWFAGLHERDVNFLFFAYVEPDGDIDDPAVQPGIYAAENELQAVLDTVQFRILETAAPEATP